MSELKFADQLVVDLFETHPQPIFWMTPVWDEDRRNIVDFEYRYCNKQLEKSTGFSSENIIGKKISNSKLLDDTLRSRFLEQIKHVYLTGEILEDTIYNPVLNTYFKFLRSKVQDGVLTVIQDRTAEYKMIRELESQKSLLNNILTHTSSGISVTELIRDENGNIIDGRIILANEASEKYAGLTKADYENKTICQIDPKILDSPIYRSVINTIETGEPFITQYYFEPTDRWLELSVSRMDENKVINVFTDISLSKKTHLEMERLVSELTRSNKHLEEFAYAASHDLKEPIRKIHTFADRLKPRLAAYMNEEEQNMYERMQNAAYRMQQLVEDLLEYSYISSTSDSKKPTDLNEKLQLAINDLEISIEDKKAKIKSDKLPVIFANGRQMQQLFLNLLSNSIKYSKPNVPPEITITTKEVRAGDYKEFGVTGDANTIYHLIEIKDNGIGFDKEESEKIFAMFHRLHGRSDYSGTGIGLSIVRRVIENHEGYIWAEGISGEGSTFKFLLPKSD